jgi:hypothetical protein
MTAQPSTYLYFDLGSDDQAFRELTTLLVSLGAKPGETRYSLNVPIRLRSELETFLPSALELLDRMDVEDCRVELRHRIAELTADGSMLAGDRLNGTWTGVSTGYVASMPNAAILDHAITASKQGPAPPVEVSDLPGGSDAWSLTDRADAWHYHWRRKSNTKENAASEFRRDRKTIASLFKGTPDLRVVSTLEHIAAHWSDPLEVSAESGPTVLLSAVSLEPPIDGRQTTPPSAPRSNVTMLRDLQ